ncbi:MAG: hypothetical protein H6742_03440 [Alphaproteobacteria bacterium]|nr:hypothetical protein [Alphaproteobacteria bacterium]
MAGDAPGPTRGRPLPLPLLVLHLGIIGVLCFQAVYSGWQVFVVMQPPGTTGLLFGAANGVDMDFLMVRRMYAMEAWVPTVGLALYLAITEILPRRLGGPPPAQR